MGTINFMIDNEITRFYIYIYIYMGHSTVPPPKKGGYGTHLYLNRWIIVVLILSVDVILKIFGYRLNRFCI